MAADRDARIRERAHAIWEREGRQHGQHDRHWAQAVAEIDAEDRHGSPANVKTEKTGTKAEPSTNGRRKRSLTDAAVDAVTRVAGAALNAAAESVTGEKRGRGARGKAAARTAAERPKRAATTSDAATTRARTAGTAASGKPRTPSVDRTAAADKPAPRGGKKGR